MNPHWAALLVEGMAMVEHDPAAAVQMLRRAIDGVREDAPDADSLASTLYIAGRIMVDSKIDLTEAEAIVEELVALAPTRENLELLLATKESVGKTDEAVLVRKHMLDAPKAVVETELKEWLDDYCDKVEEVQDRQTLDGLVEKMKTFLN